MKLLVEWSDGTLEELSADVVEFAADPDVEEEGGPIEFLQSLHHTEVKGMGEQILHDLVILLKQRGGNV